jgi:hypothetical protein
LSKNIRKRREKLWIECGGRCCYCDCQTILPEHTVKKPLPNMATLDHLRTRLHIDYDEYGAPLPGTRQEPNYNSEERTKLSCWTCNNIRGKFDQLATQTFTLELGKAKLL